MAKMDEILGLVRSGRLGEATSAIQRRLGSDPDGGGAAPGAMKDVTPRAKALPGAGGQSKAGPVRHGRAAGPAPAAGARAKPRFRPKVRLRPRTIGGPPPLTPGARWDVRAGALPHRLYVPAAPRADAPLIVMLHGCTQDPEDFARGTAMCAAAERIGAHVLWPEQTRTANPNGCWNWFEPVHQGCGGEAGAIAALAERTAAEVGTGAAGIHVAGLSAGGAMAAILGATRPDVIASVGIHSGLPAGAAADLPSALAAMRLPGPRAVPLAVPGIVFHGTADRTVAPANAARIIGAGGTVRRGEANGRRYAVRRSGDVELWEVEGLGHAWSGGDASGSHADPAGPDASAEMLRFFAAHPHGRAGAEKRG